MFGSQLVFAGQVATKEIELVVPMITKIEKGKPRYTLCLCRCMACMRVLLKSTGNKHQHRRSILDKEFEVRFAVVVSAVAVVSVYPRAFSNKERFIFREGSLLLA